MNNRISIEEAFAFRHACKKFDKDAKISQESFDAILEAGRLSPSSYGLEPWKFLVIQNQNLREKLKECSPGAFFQLETASHMVIILARKQSETAAGSDYVNYIINDIMKLPPKLLEGFDDRFKAFQGWHRIDANEKIAFDWACKQTYIAMANMMTYAAVLGIDSCPMEGFDPVAVEKILADENLLDKSKFGVSVMVAFGFRAKDQLPKARRPIGEMVEYVE